MINFIKNNFRSVRAELSYRFGRNIPVGIVGLYYVIVGLLALPLVPFAWMYYRFGIIGLGRKRA